MNDGYVTRREFVAGCAGAAAAVAAAGTGLADDAATVALADTLADYVATRDPSTAVETLGSGAALGGRWRTCRLTSQTWQGVPWTHEVSLFLRSLESNRVDSMIVGGHAVAYRCAVATEASRWQSSAAMT